MCIEVSGKRPLPNWAAGGDVRCCPSILSPTLNPSECTPWLLPVDWTEYPAWTMYLERHPAPTNRAQTPLARLSTRREGSITSAGYDGYPKLVIGCEFVPHCFKLLMGFAMKSVHRMHLWRSLAPKSLRPGTAGGFEGNSREPKSRRKPFSFPSHAFES